MQSIPPKLDLNVFLELGAVPTLTEAGTGEFLVTAIAGTVIMAGYGGDEVVTIVIGQYQIDQGPRKGQFDHKVAMIRHDLGKPLHVVNLTTDNFASVPEFVNRNLQVWYDRRAPRPADAQDFNPLKR